MAVDKIQFRPGPLAGSLAARTDVQDNGHASKVAARDLSRYYDLLALTLPAAGLSVGEAALIVDALNGMIVDLSAAQMLAAEIEDSLADGLAEKWGVDGPALVARAVAWPLALRLAICDAVERFWAAYAVESTAARLIAVGLTRQE